MFFSYRKSINSPLFFLVFLGQRGLRAPEWCIMQALHIKFISLSLFFFFFWNLQKSSGTGLISPSCTLKTSFSTLPNGPTALSNSRLLVERWSKGGRKVRCENPKVQKGHKEIAFKLFFKKKSSWIGFFFRELEKWKNAFDAKIYAFVINTIRRVVLREWDFLRTAPETRTVWFCILRSYFHIFIAFFFIFGNHHIFILLCAYQIRQGTTP